MRTAIVHIGVPRTGTTTFQRILSNFRSELERSGVLYPDLTPSSAATRHLSHQHLGETLDGRRPCREKIELLGRLEALLRRTDADTLILSYEGLALAPRWLHIPERLAGILARHGFAMTPLITVKPQDELLNSQYTWRTQFLREERPFEAYLKTQIGRKMRTHAPRLRLDRLVEPWRRACDGRLLAVPVREAKAEQPFFHRVLEAAGLFDRVAPLLGETVWRLVENRSPGPVTVEVARQLRCLGPSRRLLAAARDATRYIEQRSRERGLEVSPFQAVDGALRSRIAAAFADSNDKFAAAAWGQSWTDRVAAAPLSPVNEIAGRPRDDAAERHISEILRETRALYGT